MQVRDMMVRDVVSVSPEESAALAARLLARHNIGAMPVCGEDGRLLGMVTDRDIALRCVAEERDAQSTRVEEIMTARVYTASPTDDATEAARIMSAGQVRRLPVMEDGRLVGMLSLGDLAVRRATDTEAARALTEISANLRRG